MPMNLDSVGSVSAPGDRSWDHKDALLYALGVGAGQIDPTGFELEFTTENSQNIPQQVLPTFPVIVGMAGGGGMPSFGDINWAMLVHGEQRVEVFGPIPTEGTITSTTRIVGIYDKGSGALAVMETESKYTDTGKPAFNTRFGAFIRGEGGFGESRGDELAPRPKIPDTAIARSAAVLRNSPASISSTTAPLSAPSRRSVSPDTCKNCFFQSLW